MCEILLEALALPIRTRLGQADLHMDPSKTAYVRQSHTERLLPE